MYLTLNRQSKNQLSASSKVKIYISWTDFYEKRQNPQKRKENRITA
jgi:hypothetical protein